MARDSARAVVLVVGASGVVGRATLECFAALEGVEVIGISRRDPQVVNAAHVALDLADSVACERTLAGLTEVTHVVYAALFEKPGLVQGWVEADQMQQNLDMLKNLMVPLQQSAKGLRHVSLLQGTKAYGAHVAPMSVPGKEDAPHREHANFYWLQEDWLKAQRANAPWSLTIWRPPLIVGHAFGAPMNVLAAIGLFGALTAYPGAGDMSSDALGSAKTFCWPGGVCGPVDVVDARLLARAFGWAAGVLPPKLDAPAVPALAAQDETFNVTNGDVVVLSDLWPRLASVFGLEWGAPHPVHLQHHLPGLAPLWDELIVRHELRAPSLTEFAGDSLIYADLFFNAGGTSPMPSTLLSTIKLRKAGFAECCDTHDMFIDWVAELQKRRVLPPPLR